MIETGLEAKGLNLPINLPFLSRFSWLFDSFPHIDIIKIILYEKNREYSGSGRLQ